MHSAGATSPPKAGAPTFGVDACLEPRVWVDPPAGAPGKITRLEPTMIGQTLGRYRIVEQIGAGDMGEVYRWLRPRCQNETPLRTW